MDWNRWDSEVSTSVKYGRWVVLPFSPVPSISLPLLHCEVEHFHAAKSLSCASRCVAVVCLSVLGSNTLFFSDDARLWLFYSVPIAHDILHLPGPTKCRPGSWRRKYSVWSSMWMPDQGILMIFAVRAISMDPFFRPHSLCDAEILSVFSYEATVHRQTNVF